MPTCSSPSPGQKGCITDAGTQTPLQILPRQTARPEGPSPSPFPGEIVGLLGENGAGKTTLLKCILGLHRFQGEILLDGRPSPERTMPNCPLPPVSTPSFPPSPPRPTGIFTPGIFPGSGRPAMTG
ncbi:MAG: ATP-binding cassette domain-containing protein [Evtepia gabavorous]